MVNLLKESPEGLPESEVVQRLMDMGFSEGLVRKVVEFAKQVGKVSVPREGWMVWS